MKIFTLFLILGLVPQTVFAFGIKSRSDTEGRLNDVNTKLNALQNGMAHATGTQGDRGDPGTPGDPGNQGFQGPAGLSLQGGVGPRGPDGPVGNVGPTGNASGPKGYTGPVGDTGDMGAVGSAGINGANGARGAQGVKGPQGYSGATGPQGEDQGYNSGVQMFIQLTFPDNSRYTFNKSFYTYAQYNNVASDTFNGCDSNRLSMCN